MNCTDCGKPLGKAFTTRNLGRHRVEIVATSDLCGPCLMTLLVEHGIVSGATRTTRRYTAEQYKLAL